MTKSKNFFHNIIKPFKFHSSKEGEEEDLEKIAAKEQKIFPFQTLVSATKNFHPDNKLGQGGYGPVFKGKLSDGREIAVKKLSQKSTQGKKEFKMEAKLLARVQHRNVVNLLGYCVYPEKLLVYEYVVNESLDKLLFKSAKRDVLDWKRRFDIISGVARGLLYLHEDSHDRVIHRDIKASNILLDEKWVPKIADFGMARLYPEDQTNIQTRVAGTDGYMAPEYLMHGILSVKIDVYSFGVVVLELISGHKNSIFNHDPECQDLLEWAYKLYKRGKRLEIMESTLAHSADLDQVATCIQVGLLCTQADPQLRPAMRRVVVMLSRKPGTLEEPTHAPGYPGARYRSRRPASSSSTARTSRMSSYYTATNSTTAATNSTTATVTNSATATNSTTATVTNSATTIAPSDHRQKSLSSTSMVLFDIVFHYGGVLTINRSEERLDYIGDKVDVLYNVESENFRMEDIDEHVKKLGCSSDVSYCYKPTGKSLWDSCEVIAWNDHIEEMFEVSNEVVELYIDGQHASVTEGVANNIDDDYDSTLDINEKDVEECSDAELKSIQTNRIKHVKGMEKGKHTNWLKTMWAGIVGQEPMV